MKKFIPLLCVVLLFGSCAQEKFDWQNIEKELQTKLILSVDGDTIRIPEGHYKFKGSLTLDARKRIVIMGAGRDKTILSFKGQDEGAEGLKITNCESITVQDFTVQDTKGDGLKIQKTNKLIIKNVRAEWTGEPKKENGSYGFYPVDCDSVLMESCIAIGASDAGIYVGQSRDIIVRNSEAFHNVAGIEIENCIRADVYHNYAHCNTGGILVFDMPELPQSGHTVRVYDNTVWKNNYKNFAPEGNIVHEVPPGTGIMILATDNVEIFDNFIVNNKTIGTAITSYKLVKHPFNDPDFDLYPKTISIHDNRYKKSFWRIPALSYEMGKLLFMRFWFNVPAILYDGFLDPAALGENGKYKEEFRICVQNNEGGSFVDADAPNDFKNVRRDDPEFNCAGTRIEPVQLNL